VSLTSLHVVGFQQAIDVEQASRLGRKMQKGSFDFNDFLVQSRSLKTLGGMGGLLKLMPGKPVGRRKDSHFYSP